ncbi:MAG: hypothetical protein QOE70_2562 [Chthoniobacter sp.]|jgi:hypothetical protein|nr:hypothetical protein [Chthoniobacter sp.]
MPTHLPIAHRRVVLFLTGWLALALLAGVRGIPAALRPPWPQAVLLSLTGALLALGVAVDWLREWWRGVDVRVLVAVHLTRFVGAWFLILHRRGELPFAFAVPAGWGDLAVASAALLLLLAVSPRQPTGRRLYALWNVLGLADILFVVVTAARLALHDPASMQALLRLPLCLLPTFLVPIIIATHVWLWRRLRDRQAVLAT